MPGSSSSMSKKEMQEQLARHGETAPSGWTKIQLKSRLVELAADQADVMTEREASKMINRCKTKAMLQEKMDEFQLTYTAKMNSDHLRSALLRYLMETQVPPHEENFMGFGKHSGWTYGETAIHAPSYSAWTVETATNEPECHWRLKRYALWYQGLSRSDKVRLESVTPAPQNKKEKDMHRGDPSSRATSSIGATSSVIDSETELVAEVSQEDRLQELELELKKIREAMSKANTGTVMAKSKVNPKTTP